MCFHFRGSRQDLVLHRRCCGGHGLQGCKAAVDMEFSSAALLPFTPLATEDTGDKTGYSGTLHTPVEKKQLALTCFLLTPESPKF